MNDEIVQALLIRRRHPCQQHPASFVSAVGSCRYRLTSTRMIVPFATVQRGRESRMAPGYRHIYRNQETIDDSSP